MRSDMVYVDIDKIETVTKVNNISGKAIGPKLGHNKSWYSGVKARGSMSARDATLFRAVFGLDIIRHNIKEDNKMRNTREGLTVAVDTVKGENVRISLQLNYTQMSLKLGHAASFWGGVLRRKTMKRNDVMLFKEMFGVDLEVKKPILTTPTVNQEQESAAVVSPIDYDKLAEVMSQAIDYDKLSEAMFKAMVMALNGDKPAEEVNDTETEEPQRREKRKLE